MSKLAVGIIESVDTLTDLVFTTANTNSGNVRVFASNNTILFDGNPVFTGALYTSNVVIDVADDTNAALRITQTGTGDAIRVEDSANPDASPFVIDATGNVGIAVTNPEEKLQVAGAIVSSDATLLNKTRASSFDFSTGFNSGRILAWGSSGITANLGFWTGAGGAGTTERMRIEGATGNVLIGRTNSTVGNNVKLDINGAVNASAVLVNGTELSSGISTGKAIAMAIVFG